MNKLLAVLLLTASITFGQVISNGGAVKVIDNSNANLVNPGDSANNAIRVNVVAGSSGNACAASTGAAVPSSACYTGVHVGSNLVGVTGTTVSSTTAQDSNVALINGVVVLMGNGVTGTGSQRVTIASDNTPFTVNAAQSGTWSVTSVPKTGCGASFQSVAWVAAPTSATSIYGATTTCVLDIVVANTNTSSTQSVLITDGQGSPVTIVPTVQIPANSMVAFHFGGLAATTGAKITAGGTGLTYAATGLQ